MVVVWDANTASVVRASSCGNGCRLPRKRWSHVQSEVNPSSSARRAVTSNSSIWGVFSAEVKFSTASPNVAGMSPSLVRSL
jgi:hypothetical protein